MFGKRLKELRKENLWTLDDLAEKMGISSSTYGGYEREYRSPSLEMLSMFATFYDVSTDYILGLTDDRDPKKVESNVYEYFKKDNINWKGVPLSNEELKPIKDLLEIVVRDRLPKHIKEDKKTDTSN